MRSYPSDGKRSAFRSDFAGSEFLQIDDCRNYDSRRSFALDIFGYKSVAANNQAGSFNEIVRFPHELEKASEPSIGRAYVPNVGCVIQVEHHRQSPDRRIKPFEHSRAEHHCLALNKQCIELVEFCGIEKSTQ